MTAGTHGTTFGGNPLAMAVGNAVLDVVLAAGLPRARRAHRPAAEAEARRAAGPAPAGLRGDARRGADARPQARRPQHRLRGRRPRRAPARDPGRRQRGPAPAAAHRDGGRAPPPSSAWTRPRRPPARRPSKTPPRSPVFEDRRHDCPEQRDRPGPAGTAPPLPRPQGFLRGASCAPCWTPRRP